MKRFLLSTLLFLALLIAISYPLAYFISGRFHTYNKQDWILKQKGTTYDYALLGSSRVYNMVDVNTMNTAWAKNGINLGTSGSCYAENYIVLSEFLETNNVSRVILNLDEYSFNTANSYSYPFHDYEFLTLFNKYDSVFRDFIPGWKFALWKTLPLAKYCEFNGNYTLKQTFHTHLDENKGTMLAGHEDKKEDQKIMKEKRKLDKVDPLDEKYFHKILALCDAKHIEVIFITTPIYSAQRNQYRNFAKEFISARPELAKRKYLPFDDLIDNSNTAYFDDFTHTNSTGSLTYSDSLGKKLKLFNL